MFMVQSSCLKHCESSPWFTRWVQHGARWPPTFGPIRSAWTISPPVDCQLTTLTSHHRHFIIAQPESWYSFYHPTEGGRLRSRPSWLATYRDGLPARTRSPIHTNRARRRVTSLIETNALPLSHATVFMFVCLCIALLSLVVGTVSKQLINLFSASAVSSFSLPALDTNTISKWCV